MTELLSMDETFVRKLTEIVLANLRDENFDVEKVATEAGMSRSTIHRKLRSIKGQDLSQFIREIRLTRALELLQQNAGTASEIAFMVGFGSPAYFSKCFHEYFGYPPGQIKKEGFRKSEEANPDKVINIDSSERSKWRYYIFSPGILLLVVIIIIGYAFFFKNSHSNNGNFVNNHEKSIAVLPFRNDSPNDSTTYFLNGVMEEITNNLQKINDFSRVLSRSSVEQFRNNTTKSTPEIAKKLNVNYIVEGSGQKYRNRFVLRVQLIVGNNERNLWGKSYDREIHETSDIFSIQSEIAESIAAELETVITPQEKQLIEKTPTDNLEAYRLYMLGVSLMTQWNEDAYLKAIDYYHQAIALDSSFAQPYAGLASAYFELSSWDVSAPSSEFIPQAKAWALKSLKIDKDLAEAYFVIAAINYIHEWEWNGAEHAFKKGMELNPNYIWGRIFYANFLTAMGRFKESITISQQTLKLNPLDPSVYNELAFAMFLNGQDETALELYNESLDINPGFDQTLCLMAMLYARKGQYDKALSILQKELKLFDNEMRNIPAFNLGLAGQIFGLAGRRDEALTLLHELNRRAGEKDYKNTTYMAYIYIGLSENQKALELLEKGFNDKDYALVWLKVNSMFDLLQSNERFKQLLKKMRFTD
jgi:TolB-like protein/AraC-like DNA-binding protein/Tfp pilus assembly protein PilF